MNARPLFAGVKTAAKLFDITPDDFAKLVEAGHLPPPKEIGKHRLWNVDELHRIANGDALDSGSMKFS